MRFASCSVAGRRFAARVIDDVAIPLAGMDELGPGLDIARLKRAACSQRHRYELSEVTLEPVVPRPGKIICVGRNYPDPAKPGAGSPAYPVFFTKYPEALLGAGAAIEIPPESRQVDYEAELAVVIGRTGRRIPRTEALEYVAGYTAANDVTMRDYQGKSHQWLQGKTWPRTTPLGPVLVTPDEVGDVADLTIRLQLNGTELQCGRVGDQIFGVQSLIAALSEFLTLEPGDVILTGTPAGVGNGRDPQVFLAPGDHVTVEIDRIGVLENDVVAERMDGQWGRLRRASAR